MNKLWLQYDRKALQELDKFKDKGTVFAFASLSQGHVHCVVLNTEKTGSHFTESLKTFISPVWTEFLPCFIIEKAR